MKIFEFRASHFINFAKPAQLPLPITPSIAPLYNPRLFNPDCIIRKRKFETVEKEVARPHTLLEPPAASPFRLIAPIFASTALRQRCAIAANVLSAVLKLMRCIIDESILLPVNPLKSFERTHFSDEICLQIPPKTACSSKEKPDKNPLKF